MRIAIAVVLVLTVLTFGAVSAALGQSDRQRAKQPPDKDTGRQSLSPSNPVREYIYLGDRLIAIDAGINPPPAVPSGVTADRCYTMRVNLRWTHDGSVTGFTIERKTGAGSFQTLTPNPSLTGSSRQYLDTGLSAGTTYTYRIRADGSGGSSSFSAEAPVTTAGPFTDPTLVSGVTKIKGAHVEELRDAVNAVRTCAALAQFTGWAQAAPLSTKRIKGVDVEELRSQIQAAWSPLGLTPPTYTDGPVLSGVRIKKVHIEELRNAVQ